MSTNIVEPLPSQATLNSQESNFVPHIQRLCYCLGLALLIYFFLSNALSQELPYSFIETNHSFLFGLNLHLVSILSFVVGFVVCLSPSFIICRLIKPAKVLSATLISCAVVSMLLPYSPNVLCLLIGRTIQGIGASLFVGTSLRLIYHYIPHNKRFVALVIALTMSYIGMALSFSLSKLSIELSTLLSLTSFADGALVGLALIIYKMPESQNFARYRQRSSHHLVSKAAIFATVLAVSYAVLNAPIYYAIAYSACLLACILVKGSSFFDTNSTEHEQSETKAQEHVIHSASITLAGSFEDTKVHGYVRHCYRNTYGALPLTCFHLNKWSKNKLNQEIDHALSLNFQNQHKHDVWQHLSIPHSFMTSFEKWHSSYTVEFDEAFYKQSAQQAARAVNIAQCTAVPTLSALDDCYSLDQSLEWAAEDDLTSELDQELYAQMYASPVPTLVSAGKQQALANTSVRSTEQTQAQDFELEPSTPALSISDEEIYPSAPSLVGSIEANEDLADYLDNEVAASQSMSDSYAVPPLMVSAHGQSAVSHSKEQVSQAAKATNSSLLLSKDEIYPSAPSLVGSIEANEDLADYLDNEVAASQSMSDSYAVPPLMISAHGQSAVSYSEQVNSKHPTHFSLSHEELYSASPLLNEQGELKADEELDFEAEDLAALNVSDMYPCPNLLAI